MANERERSARKGSPRKTERPEEGGSPSGRPTHIVWAVMSAVVLVVSAPGLFVAGFFTNELVSDDEGGTVVVAQPSPSVSTPSTPTTGTPPPVVAASADDDPFIGPADASVTVIEFADYQWPFCKRFRDETLDDILETYEGRIKFVIRDFPLTSIHQYAQKAAEATECADDQGKFWEYHDLLFANQSAIDADSLKGYAAELGLDPATFDDCLDTGKHASEVQKDSQDALSYGATGTPAFFIDGQFVSGAQPFSVFQQVIDAALTAGG